MGVPWVVESRARVGVRIGSMPGELSDNTANDTSVDSSASLLVGDYDTVWVPCIPSDWRNSFPDRDSTPYPFPRGLDLPAVRLMLGMPVDVAARFLGCGFEDMCRVEKNSDPAPRHMSNGLFFLLGHPIYQQNSYADLVLSCTDMYKHQGFYNISAAPNKPIYVEASWFAGLVLEKAVNVAELEKFLSL